MDTTPAPKAAKAKKVGMVKAKEESEEEDDDEDEEDDEEEGKIMKHFTIMQVSLMCSGFVHKVS